MLSPLPQGGDHRSSASCRRQRPGRGQATQGPSLEVRPAPGRPLPPSGSPEPACSPAPKAAASIQCRQMTRAREDVLPQPRKESRQSPLSPARAFLSNSPARPSTARPRRPRPAPPWLPAPTQGSADPAEPGRQPRNGRWPCPVSARRPLRTQKSSFSARARAAEVINIRGGAAIKVRPGDAARPQALCTAVPVKAGSWRC